MTSTFSLTDAWLGEHFPDLTDVRPLTQGGQKLVFAAEHPTDGAVVLKLLRSMGQGEEVRREILAVERVQSPRVPRILASGEIATPLGACLWIREPRIDGQTVRACLARGPLSPGDTLRLGQHVLEALERAEQAKIVHRDIKPDNLMRTAAGDVWLLDFGIARHLTLESMTATALPWGKMTWGYAPPEQYRNAKAEIDVRADLFALGVTMYECATGENPHRAGAASQLEIIHRVEHVPLPPLMLPIAAATSFADLVGAMTQKRRDHRPASASEALAWLNEVCAAEGL